MKITKNQKQWGRLLMLVMLGFASFVALAGDDPQGELSLMQFLAIKAAALVTFCVCMLTGRHLGKKGKLPIF